MFKVGSVVRSIVGWPGAFCDHGTGRYFDLKPGMLAVVIRAGKYHGDPRVTVRDFEGREHTWSQVPRFWEVVTDA